MGETSLKMGAEGSELEREYRKAFGQQEKYIAKLRRDNERIKQDSRSVRAENVKTTEDSFGDRARAKITGYVAGVLAIGTAVKGVRDIYATLNAEVEKGVQAIGRMETPMSRLAQLATPQRPMKQLVAETRASMLSGLPEGEAAGLTFAAESGGFPGLKPQLAKLFPTISPAMMAEQLTMASGALGETAPKKGALLNMFIAAAAKSPLVTEEFAPLVSKVAPLGQLVGASPTEMFASLASMAGPAGGGAEAATQLNAVMKTMAERGIAGGLESGAREVGGQLAGMSPAQRVKYFGRIEGLKGFAAFQKSTALRGEITGLVEEAAAMEPGAKAGDIQRARRTIPALQLAELGRVSEAHEVWSLMESGGVAAEARIGAYKKVARAGWRRSGDWFDRAQSESWLWMSSWYSTKGGVLGGTGEAGEWQRRAKSATRAMSDEELSELLTSVLRDATGEGMKDAARGGTHAPTTQRGDRVEQ